MDDILIKTYKYFNGVSPWNLDARIPEALIADKEAIVKHLVQVGWLKPYHTAPKDLKRFYEEMAGMTPNSNRKDK